MIHFDPPVSIKLLADVEPGSIVRSGEQGQHPRFCVISSDDPNQRKAFAVYNAEAHRFDWEYAESPTVVTYGNDVIVRPDVGSFAPELTAQVDGTLYTLDGAPHLIVAVRNAMRFSSLASGELQSRQSWPKMGGYCTWTAGVRGLDNRLVELLSVSPKSEAAAESVEPNEV